MAHKHIVKRGDGIESIAFENGFYPDTIWEWPDNSKLKELRKDMHILAPGDEVFVPDVRVKDESKPAEKRHWFRRRGVPEEFTVTLLDFEGAPYANTSYKLLIDGELIEGKTDDQGTVKSPIPPGAKTAELTLEDPPREYVFHLGAVDPIDQDAGVAHRLHALGYEIDDDETDLSSEEAAAAIAAFQTDEGLDPTGELDDDSRDALKSVFGA